MNRRNSRYGRQARRANVDCRVVLYCSVGQLVNASACHDNGDGGSGVVGVAPYAHPGLSPWYDTTDIFVPQKSCRLCSLSHIRGKPRIFKIRKKGKGGFPRPGLQRSSSVDSTRIGQPCQAPLSSRTLSSAPKY